MTGERTSGSSSRIYHDELLAHGVKDFGWEQCWEEYRRQSFHGILMTVGGVDGGRADRAR